MTSRTSLFSSLPYNTLLIQLPQRFQIIEGNSPLRAAVKLMPFNLLIASGAVIGNIITGKLRVPPIYVLLFGAILLSVGVGLLNTLPQASHWSGIVYFFEVLGGIGMGVSFGITIALPAYILQMRDLGKYLSAIPPYKLAII